VKVIEAALLDAFEEYQSRKWSLKRKEKRWKSGESKNEIDGEMGKAREVKKETGVSCSTTPANSKSRYTEYLAPANTPAITTSPEPRLLKVLQQDCRIHVSYST
jgi:hypothetical protein